MAKNEDKLSMKPYRGTRDFFPDEMSQRNIIFGKMKSVATSFGYEEYDGPMLEKFDLYAAKSGEELVKDQLYHFVDRGGRHIAIRPEMTPTAARMVASRMQDLPRPIRWFSLPNLWRYEKPQRGRLREHWQFNVDILGVDSVSADQEIIEVAIGILKSLGGTADDFQIHIANRRLLTHFLAEILKLEDNAWGAACKAIDKRAKIPVDVFEGMLEDASLTRTQIDGLNAYMSLDLDSLRKHVAFDCDGGRELDTLFQGLDHAGLSEFCRLDLSIVRGLDYYTGTVFEMYDMAPENKRALFGGGRYDDLVGLFSNNRLPGVGFGMGDVTIIDFLTTHNLMPEPPPPVEVFVTLFDESGLADTLNIARFYRNAGFRTCCHLEPAKLGKQFKLADRRRIPVVILQGPDEKNRGMVNIKFLSTGEQISVSLEESVQEILKLIN